MGLDQENITGGLKKAIGISAVELLGHSVNMEDSVIVIRKIQ